MLSFLAYVVGLVAVAYFVNHWYITSPAVGSGWSLFAAIAIAYCMSAPSNHFVGFMLYGALAAGFGIVWYNVRTYKVDAGWLLVMSIVSAINITDYI